MVSENGVILPSVEDLNKAVSTLITGIAQDQRVNEQFRADPVGYFKGIGIATDGVPEVMRELGLNAEAAAISICFKTCWFTGCALTCWNTTVNHAAVKLQATAEPLRG